MPDPTPKPWALIEGHRSKADKEQRKQAEQALCTGNAFQEEPATKADLVAHREYMRLKRLYAKIPYIDGLDQGIINRYCQEVSNLAEINKNLTEARCFARETEETEQKITAYRQINSLLNAAHRSKELLIKYDTQLFLSPAARIKAIPKKEPEKEPANPMEKAGFYI